MKKLKFDFGKIYELRDNLGISLFAARRMLWKDQMIEYVSSAETVDELKEALLEVIRSY